jgi:dTDP-4-dehydrorhamnose reductase
LNEAVLVVGADSMIGAALLTAFNENDVPVTGTTRRPPSEHHFLDLADDPSTWQVPFAQTAIICAGVTRLKACHDNPSGTALINVDQIGALVERLLDAGTFVIYLSSDKVFDGTRPHIAPDAAYSPVTEYGRQKMRAEAYLLKHEAHAAILRLSKVLGDDNPLFASWMASLKRGEVITPFSDMFLAPISVRTIVTVVQLIVMARMGGIWQLSGQEDVSYADVGRHAARILGVDESLVQPMKMADSGLMPDPAGPYTSMNVDRLQSAFGVSPPDVWWTLESTLREATL